MLLPQSDLISNTYLWASQELNLRNGFLFLFWLVVNHKCAEPDSVFIKVDQSG